MIQAPVTSISQKRDYSEISKNRIVPVVVCDDSPSKAPHKKARRSFLGWVTQQAQNRLLNPLLSRIWPTPVLIYPTLPLLLPLINYNHLLLSKVVWAHGGSAATLVGAHFTENKLFPYGRLQQLTIDKGIVPFTGTFDGGSSLHGVNQRGLSGVTAHTGYRFYNAWNFANMACTHISSEVLEQKYFSSLQKIHNACSNNILSEEKINHFSRSFSQLKSWNPEFLDKLLNLKHGSIEDKNRYRQLKSVLKHIPAQLEIYAGRLRRLCALLGDQDKLLSFKRKVIRKFFTMTQDKHTQLVGRHPSGFLALPRQLLTDVIYMEMRRLKLIFTKKHRRIVEQITYDAYSLHNFGGHRTSNMASGITALNDSVFEAAYIAVLTGYIIKNSSAKLLAALNIPTNFVSRSTMFNDATIARELASLQKKVEKYQSYTTTCLSLEDNMENYSDAHKALISRNIPILYCASRLHSSMRPVGHENLWEAADGVPLGHKNGIDILLTDTPENQAHIKHFLESEDIPNVSVGIYEKDIIGKRKPLQ